MIGNCLKNVQYVIDTQQIEINSNDLNVGELEKGRVVRGYWDVSFHMYFGYLWLEATLVEMLVVPSTPIHHLASTSLLLSW